MIRLILCDHSDAYILIKGTATFPNTAVADADANDIIKNCNF